MTERGILFSASMIRAILAGQKTVTRRVVDEGALKVRVPRFIRAEMPRIFGDTSVQPGIYPASMNAHGAVSVVNHAEKSVGLKPDEFEWVSPYGETLWVREAWAAWFQRDGVVADWKDTPKEARTQANLVRLAYRATEPDAAKRWVTPLFMPRWASRLTLTVKSVRVERLQSITEDDARREGVALCNHAAKIHDATYVRAYACLWDELNAKRAPWSSNPWIYRVEFVRAGGDR